MVSIAEKASRPVRPVKAIQFGEGNFLRAFVDYQIDTMNEKAGFHGDVVLVQPLERGMGDMINSQNGFYTTVLRGIEDGKVVEELRTVGSVRGCINPYHEYDEYMALADNPDLRFVFSNTTEAGIVYDPSVSLSDRPQNSFPGKVTAFLYRRYRTFSGDVSKGLVFIPCELIDKNGSVLHSCVLRHAEDWKLEEGFKKWLEASCDFCCSLVDRIVPGYPRGEAEAICEKLGYEDKLLVSAEKFLFWAIEYNKKSYEDELPTSKAGLNVVWTPDMSFYRTRKVRILNGAHTMTVLAAYLHGLDTVEECMKSELVSSFMKKGLFEEIIPSMDGDKELLVSYAGDVLDRFRNPYIVHLLLSISLNSTSKFKTRDLPSLLGYYEKTGKLPDALTFSLASLIAFYEGKRIEEGALIGERNGKEYRIQDSPAVLEKFLSLYTASYGCNHCKAKRIADEILGEKDWWGMDLRTIPGLEEKVEGYLWSIWNDGMEKAMSAVVGK